MRKSKRVLLIVAALSLAILDYQLSIASSGCTYPTSLDSWADKVAGDQLTVADVNQFRCAIEQIEGTLGYTGALRFPVVTGLGGGQAIYGGVNASGSLTLGSTAHATKGVILFGGLGGYDELNTRLGIGTTLPSVEIDIAKSDATSIYQTSAVTGGNGPSYVGQRARGNLGARTAVQASDILLDLKGQGFDGSGYVLSSLIRMNALETFTGSVRGSSIEFWTTEVGTNAPARVALMSGGYGLGLDAGSSFINLTEEAANPGDPGSGIGAILYMKDDKFIIKYNDSGTIRFKYLDLTGTGVTWVHTTSAP